MNNIVILIIFSILPLQTGWNSRYQYYQCKRDKCSCCYTKSDGHSTNYNNDTRQLNYYPGRSEHMTYLHNSDSKIKLIYNDTITIYECPDSYPSIYKSPNFYPASKNRIQFSRPGKNVFEEDELVDEMFQKCLHFYCDFQENKNNMLTCRGYGMQSFNFQFTTTITPRCVQNITFVRVTNITTLNLHKSNFLNYAINVIYMQLRIPKHESGVNVRCSSFFHMNKLRLLYISSLTLAVAKCMLTFNPDLIRIAYRDKIVWNMCHNNVSIYDTNTMYQYNEGKAQQSTTTEIVSDNKNWRLKYSLTIAIIGLSVLIIVSAYLYYIKPQTIDVATP